MKILERINYQQARVKMAAATDILVGRQLVRDVNRFFQRSAQGLTEIHQPAAISAEIRASRHQLVIEELTGPVVMKMSANEPANQLEPTNSLPIPPNPKNKLARVAIAVAKALPFYGIALGLAAIFPSVLLFFPLIGAALHGTYALLKHLAKNKEAAPNRELPPQPATTKAKKEEPAQVATEPAKPKEGIRDLVLNLEQARQTIAARNFIAEHGVTLSSCPYDDLILVGRSPYQNDLKRHQKNAESFGDPTIKAELDKIQAKFEHLAKQGRKDWESLGEQYPEFVCYVLSKLHSDFHYPQILNILNALENSKLPIDRKAAEEHLLPSLHRLLAETDPAETMLTTAFKRTIAVLSKEKASTDETTDKQKPTTSQTADARAKEDEELNVDSAYEVIAHTKTRFSDVGGAAKALQEAQDLALAIKNLTLMPQWGTTPPKGILLHGSPGNGKTLIGKAIATEAEAVFVLIHLGRVIGQQWVGWQAKCMLRVFERIRKLVQENQDKPIILFLDEIDSIGIRRGGASVHQETANAQNVLLQELDGFGEAGNIIAIATTNRKEELDPALIRTGRFDRHIEVPNPDREGRRKILEIHSQKKEELASGSLFTDGWLTEEILTATEGFSGSDLAEVLRKATYDNFIADLMNNRKRTIIGTAQLLAVIQEIKNQRAEKQNRQIGFGHQ